MNGRLTEPSIPVPHASEHGKCIQWESITGLPNKGLVVFEEKEPGVTAMTLTISYSVPKPIAKVAGNVRFVQEYIKSTLLQDLTRYKKELLKEIREEARREM